MRNNKLKKRVRKIKNDRRKELFLEFWDEWGITLEDIKMLVSLSGLIIIPVLLNMFGYLLGY